MSVVEQPLHEILCEIAMKEKYFRGDIKIKPISSEGANYTTSLFTATIKAPGKENIEVFAKYANIGVKMRGNSDFEQLYEIERFFYTELYQKYDDLFNKNEIPQEHRLIIPKFYASNKIRFEETIVLENLIAKGFSTYDRMKSVDWEYASKAMEELAKLHALSFAYGEENPKEFKEMLINLRSDRFEIMGKTPQGMAFFNLMSKNILGTVKEENKERLNKFMKEKLNPISMNAYSQPLRRPVLIHGDYRQSNLMHKKDNDGNLQIAILDWQTLQTGCPIMDIIYFIFNCSDEEFRHQYYEKLVEHYYTQLCLALQRLHVDPNKVYPREDFEYELKEMLPFGLCVAMLVLQIVTVEAANAPKMDGEMSQLDIKPSDVYSERLNGIINDYVRWGII